MTNNKKGPDFDFFSCQKMENVKEEATDPAGLTPSESTRKHSTWTKHVFNSKICPNEELPGRCMKGYILFV